MTVGDYELISKIGEGSSGQVYIATHKITGGQAAAKLLKLNLLSDPAAVRRFQQEAQAISSLVHPNITSVLEFGVLPDGRPFLVMDYAGPTTLADVLTQRGTIDFKQANAIFLQIVDALRAAHNAGILHRDIKPSNIIIDDQNNVKVIDFGIAKINGIETTVTMTRTGATVGTPAYMSPEQCLGGQLDSRSDIYSLGCLMYECLSGKKVFASDNAFLCMNQHSFEPALPLSKLIKGLPDFLLSAVMTCLQKTPSHRFQSMGELKTVLDAVSDSQTKTQMAARSTLFKSFIRRSMPSRSRTVTDGKSVAANNYGLLMASGIMVLFSAFAAIALLDFSPRKEITKPAATETISQPTTAPPTKTEEKDPEVRSLERKFKDIEKEIANLKKANQNSAAETMSAEFQKYQNMFASGQLMSPKTHGDEVHSITVQKGYGGIGSYRYGKPLAGTTTVDVTYTGNPVILTLSSEQPVDWKVNTAPGVQVKQIILTGPEPKSVNLPPGAKLKVNPPELVDTEVFLPFDGRVGDLDFERVHEIARRELSAELVSVQSSEDSRKTIVVGTESLRWRAQYVMWRMHSFYQNCMKSRDKHLNESLHKVTFDSVWLNNDFVAPTQEIGSFTPFGPQKSTLKKVDKMAFFDAISATPPGEKKCWFLLNDGRDEDPKKPILAKYDPDKDKLTTLFAPDDKNSRVWWSYRSITYDTKRNSLIILAQSDEVPFLTYDLNAGKLSPFGAKMPYGMELYAIVYNPENDKTLALATDLMSRPYHLQLCQFRNGKLEKSVQLSKDFVDVESLSMCKVHLNSVGPYAIAMITNEMYRPGDVNHQNPMCAVIERSTGKVVFSGEMKR